MKIFSPIPIPNFPQHSQRNNQLNRWIYWHRPDSTMCLISWSIKHEKIITQPQLSTFFFQDIFLHLISHTSIKWLINVDGGINFFSPKAVTNVEWARKISINNFLLFFVIISWCGRVGNLSKMRVEIWWKAKIFLKKLWEENFDLKYS